MLDYHLSMKPGVELFNYGIILVPKASDFGTF